MYVRLAFAVAAHLEPEILLVDEVLAVGDAAFQKKCLGKMGDVAKEGRTVLFVSHNMDAVQRLCGRAVWLKDGVITLVGKTRDIVSKYLEHTLSAGAKQRQLLNPNALAYYKSVKMLNAYHREVRVLPVSSPLAIEASIVNMTRNSLNVQAGLDILTIQGVLIMNTNSQILGYHPIILRTGSTIIQWKINELRLMPGLYTLNLRLKDSRESRFMDFWEQAMTFEVIGSGEQISAKAGITYMPISLKII